MCLEQGHEYRQILSGEAFGLFQFGIDSGDLTSEFGSDTRITVNSTDDAIAILQDTAFGFARTSLGAGTHINATGGGFAAGVLQMSTDNRFVLGENSTINVRAGIVGFGLLQDITATPATNRTIIGANSRIDVVAADFAAGIFSEAEGTTSSFLTVEQGAEISATADEAVGVDIDADNFKVQNRGRITATSTDFPRRSFGVRTFGEGNNFENHGSVFADLAPTSYAILMTGNNNMLSLLTYPVIQGRSPSVIAAAADSAQAIPCSSVVALMLPLLLVLVQMA